MCSDIEGVQVDADSKVQRKCHAYLRAPNRWMLSSGHECHAGDEVGFRVLGVVDGVVGG